MELAARNDALSPLSPLKAEARVVEKTRLRARCVFVPLVAYVYGAGDSALCDAIFLVAGNRRAGPGPDIGRD